MAVLLDTSAGDIVIDLYTKDCPITTKNFLKLCKIKYYNGCLFFNLQQNLIIQTGDPTGSGKGGTSIYGILYGDQASTFQDEIRKNLRHNKIGLVSMANSGEHTNRSQFFITLRGEDLHHLDDKHTIFGEVAEGLEVLQKLNNLYCDEDGRPFQDVRIKHTHILDDPFPDPDQLEIPPFSPERAIPADEKVQARIPFEENIEEPVDGRTEEEIELSIKRKEAISRAIVLEMTGDIPDAEVKPPEEVLFVCKLNPVTTDEDLELIFSRFGPIKCCEIIRDPKTGDSLNYAFIEFETEDACIEAFEKMNNVLIDDRRIKVDFSQSVSKLWNRFLLQPRSTNKKSFDKGVVSAGKGREPSSGRGFGGDRGRGRGRGQPGGFQSRGLPSNLQLKGASGASLANQRGAPVGASAKSYEYDFEERSGSNGAGVGSRREGDRDRQKGVMSQSSRRPRSPSPPRRSRSRSRERGRQDRGFMQEDRRQGKVSERDRGEAHAHRSDQRRPEHSRARSKERDGRHR